MLLAVLVRVRHNFNGSTFILLVGNFTTIVVGVFVGADVASLLLLSVLVLLILSVAVMLSLFTAELLDVAAVSALTAALASVMLSLFVASACFPCAAALSFGSVSSSALLVPSVAFSTFLHKNHV